jgi:hypothetical protein
LAKPLSRFVRAISLYGQQCSKSLFARDPLKFNENGQLFIRTHNETLSLAAMSVNNPDRSPVGINR